MTGTGHQQRVFAASPYLSQHPGLDFLGRRWQCEKIHVQDAPNRHQLIGAQSLKLVVVAVLCNEVRASRRHMSNHNAQLWFETLVYTHVHKRLMGHLTCKCPAPEQLVDSNLRSINAAVCRPSDLLRRLTLRPASFQSQTQPKCVVCFSLSTHEPLTSECLQVLANLCPWC